MFSAGHLKGVWLIGLGLEMPLENGFFSPHLIMLEIGLLLLTGHFVNTKLIASIFSQDHCTACHTLL